MSNSRYVPDRWKIAPYDMAGGEPGAPGRNWVERTDGTRTELSGTDRIEVAPGDVFVIKTPGGGFGKLVSAKRAAE